MLAATVPTGRLSAQVNIEALRPAGLPEGRSGSFTGNLTVRTGNVDFVQIDFAGRHNVVGERITTLLVLDGGIGLLGRSRFASSGLFHWRQTLRLREWLSPEWYAQVNYDRAQLLRFRMLGGTGVRGTLTEGAWGEVGAGTAVMLEHERLALPDSAVHPQRTTVVRSSTFLTVRAAANDNFVVTSTTYVQPEFRNPGDVRVLENLRLASSITESLALSVSFDLRFDSDPPDGISRLDTTLRTGVTYTY
jgi:hypothetical protein